MALYRIRWKVSASKELAKIRIDILQKIIKAVEELAENPVPVKSRKLKGTEYTYRIRVGDYRVIYSMISKELIIEVVRVGHRKDIYKKFKRRK